MANFHTEKVWENQIFDHLQKKLNSHLTIFKKLQILSNVVIDFLVFKQIYSRGFCSGAFGANKRTIY